jgi:protein SCO1/2
VSSSSSPAPSSSAPSSSAPSSSAPSSSAPSSSAPSSSAPSSSAPSSSAPSSSAAGSLVGWLLRLVVIAGLFVGAVFVANGPGTRAPASLSTPTVLTTAAPTAGCDVGAGPCRTAFDTHHGITLAITPRPIRTAAPLVVEAAFDGAATNPRVTFTGATMAMPPTTLPLRPQGAGRFVARGALPLCTEAVMPWTARVDVDLDGEPHSATFVFVTRRTAGDEAASADARPDAGIIAGADEIEFFADGAVVDVELADGRGPLALASMRGSAVLVGFGFTSCADVCPTTLSSWAAALRLLAPEELARVHGLFVSVDPARDSAAHVDDYARYFHPRLRGATGTRAQIDAATRAFGAVYALRVVDGVDAGPDYLVDHSAFTWLVDARGRIVARLPHAAGADVVAGAIRRVLQAQP